MTAERRCFRTPRTCFGGVAAHDTLKSGLSVSAAGRPVSVVPRLPGRGPPTEPTAHPARSGQLKSPGAGELATLRPRPAHGARAAAASPNSYFCLLFVSLWGPAAGGTRAGVPAPAGTAPLRRGRAAASRPPGSAERGCVDARPPRRPGGACVLAARRPLAFPTESFAVGTSPCCAGRRAAEAAGRGPWSIGRSWAPGREPEQQPGPDAAPPAASRHRRLPPPPPRDSGSSARRIGATFPLRLYSERGSLSPPAPPSHALPFHPSLVCTTPRQNIATSRLQIWSFLNILFIFFD